MAVCVYRFYGWNTSQWTVTLAGIGPELFSISGACQQFAADGAELTWTPSGPTVRCTGTPRGTPSP